MKQQIDAYKISPSALPYTWVECKRCFYEIVNNGRKQPSIPMAGVWHAYHKVLERWFMNQQVNELLPELDIKPGKFVKINKGYVISKITNGCYVSGIKDISLLHDDGEISIPDFKISTARVETLLKYAPQLSAYKYADENPLEKGPVKVHKAFIVAVKPTQVFTTDTTGHYINALPRTITTSNDITIVEMPEVDMPALFDQIRDLLNGEIPDYTPGCQWCDDRRKSSMDGYMLATKEYHKKII